MVAGLRRWIDAMWAAAGLQQGAGRSLPTVFFFLQGRQVVCIQEPNPSILCYFFLDLSP
jgi:hypothetical protein